MVKKNKLFDAVSKNEVDENLPFDVVPDTDEAPETVSDSEATSGVAVLSGVPESLAPAIHLEPEPGTIKHFFKTELDQPEESLGAGEQGFEVIPIRGKFRKEIWNGDREVLILPADMVAEWERDITTFDQKLSARLREQGFNRVQMVDGQILQPHPNEKGSFVVVKKR